MSCCTIRYGSAYRSTNLTRPFFHVEASVAFPESAQDFSTALWRLGYEHDLLLTCQGKPAGDSSLGSSIVAMTWSPSATAVVGQTAAATSAAAAAAQIQAPGTSFIPGSGQSPAFGSPPGSTALRLDGSAVYSMLENGVATAPCPGLCFESWIKVERAPGSTIAVAYTSERSPRAEGAPTEEQTFVLGVPQPSSSSSLYDLVG